MGEDQTSEDVITRESEGARRPDHQGDSEERALDPGAYIGSEPELAADRLPEGVQPGDERVAAHDSAPGVPGEPEDRVGTGG